jgi:hypothetical protein
MMKSVSIDIPNHWTDEEALTVFEFIDGIRDQIWDHYCLQIQSAAKSTRHIKISMEDPDDVSEEQTDLFDDQIPF